MYTFIILSTRCITVFLPITKYCCVFVYYCLDDHQQVAVKALQVLVELWKKNIWADDKTVNTIGAVCFEHADKDKLVTGALHFFLGMLLFVICYYLLYVITYYMLLFVILVILRCAIL